MTSRTHAPAPDKLATHVARLERRSRREFDRLNRELRGSPQNVGAVVSTMPALDALLDPRVGDSMAELMLASFAAATGQNNQPRECFGCRAPWTLDRGLVGAVLVELLDRDGQAMLAGLCGDCFGNEVVLMAAVKRDFGPDFQLVMPAGTA